MKNPIKNNTKQELITSGTRPNPICEIESDMIVESNLGESGLIILASLAVFTLLFMGISALAFFLFLI